MSEPIKVIVAIKQVFLLMLFANLAVWADPITLDQERIMALVEQHHPQSLKYAKYPFFAYKTTTDNISAIPAFIISALGAIDKTNYPMLTNPLPPEERPVPPQNIVIALQMAHQRPPLAPREDFYVIGNDTYDSVYAPGVPAENVERQNPIYFVDVAPVLARLPDRSNLVALQKRGEIWLIKMSDLDLLEAEVIVVGGAATGQTKPAGCEGYLNLVDEKYYLINAEFPCGIGSLPLNYRLIP